MNDTPVKRPPTETIGKLSPGSLGAPLAALADENINKATMGYIIGVVHGTITKKMPKPDGTDEIFRGLRGSFKAVPLNEDKPEKRSAVLYLPDGLNSIMETVERLEKDKQPVMIKMAAEFFVHRAKNASGYSWGLRSMLPEDADTDPLAELEAAVKPGGNLLAAPAEANVHVNVQEPAEGEKVHAKHK